MLINLTTATYLDRVTKAIDSGKGEIPLTNRCPECGQIIDSYVEAAEYGDGHVVYQVTSDNYAILIGCEGYWVTDPTLVGLPKNGWMSPEEQIVCVNTPPLDDEDAADDSCPVCGRQGCIVAHEPRTWGPWDTEGRVGN